MTEPLLSVEDLVVTFGGRRGGRVRAVRGVSLTVRSGECVGVVGESGSGKSTLARAVLRLNRPERGRVVFDNVDLLALSKQEMRRRRRDLQIVFQDPYSSLDPTMTIGASVTEPRRFHDGLAHRDAHLAAVDLLNRVGLDPVYAGRYPADLSGGQRQRVAIARAISTNPRLLVCDEPVSALDVSTQNQVVNLLSGLRATSRMAMLFIAHDLAVVNHLADHVAVMYLGRIVESGPTERVLGAPAHPYTQALLDSVPSTEARRSRSLPSGEPPDPTAPPSGCAYHVRCPHATARCRDDDPLDLPVSGGGTASCHLLDPSTGSPVLVRSTKREVVQPS